MEGIYYGQYGKLAAQNIKQSHLGKDVIAAHLFKVVTLTNNDTFVTVSAVMYDKANISHGFSVCKCIFSQYFKGSVIKHFSIQAVILNPIFSFFFT